MRKFLKRIIVSLGAFVLAASGCNVSTGIAKSDNFYTNAIERNMKKSDEDTSKDEEYIYFLNNQGANNYGGIKFKNSGPAGMEGIKHSFMFNTETGFGVIRVDDNDSGDFHVYYFDENYHFLRSKVISAELPL